MTRWYFLLSGRVQGVGLRFRTTMLVRKLKLTGWIHNRPDGTVEMELQGTQDAIDCCLQNLHAVRGLHFSVIRADELPVIPEEMFRIQYTPNDSE